jgi:hypothetical protein
VLPFLSRFAGTLAAPALLSLAQHFTSQAPRHFARRVHGLPGFTLHALRFFCHLFSPLTQKHLFIEMFAHKLTASPVNIALISPTKKFIDDCPLVLWATHGGKTRARQEVGKVQPEQLLRWSASADAREHGPP